MGYAIVDDAWIAVVNNGLYPKPYKTGASITMQIVPEIKQ